MCYSIGSLYCGRTFNLMSTNCVPRADGPPCIDHDQVPISPRASCSREYLGNIFFSQHINDEILAVQRKKHSDLIQQLKTQLEDLESYAYESGEAIVPSNLLQERQKLVMGEN